MNSGFWFRFIYKYRSAIEIGNYEYVKKIVTRDFSAYSGAFLEKYFREKMSLSNKFSSIGNSWEKGNKNEIDIVAINDIEKRIVFCEVKLNKNKICIPLLEEKSKKIISKLSNYSVEYRSLSLQDM